MIHAIKFLIKIALSLIIIFMTTWAFIIASIVMWDYHYMDLSNESIMYLWTGKKKG